MPLVENGAAGNGGSSPSLERVTIASQAVVGSTGASLSMAHGGGSALLDYTDPTQPVFVAAGTYAVTLNLLLPLVVAQNAETNLNVGPDSVSGVWSLALAVAAESNRDYANLALTTIVAAANTLIVFEDHSDALMSHNFGGSLVVVKLA